MPFHVSWQGWAEHRWQHPDGLQARLCSPQPRVTAQQAPRPAAGKAPGLAADCSCLLQTLWHPATACQATNLSLPGPGDHRGAPIQSGCCCRGSLQSLGTAQAVCTHRVFLHDKTSRSCRETPHLHHSTQCWHLNPHQGCRAQGQHPAAGLDHGRHRWAPQHDLHHQPHCGCVPPACPAPQTPRGRLEGGAQPAPSPCITCKVSQLRGCQPRLRSQGSKNCLLLPLLPARAGCASDKRLQRKRERRLRGC